MFGRYETFSLFVGGQWTVDSGQSVLCETLRSYYGGEVCSVYLLVL